MKPSFQAYAVTEYTSNGEKKSQWDRIGVAFPHKDGKGFDIVLSALPVSGKVVLREPKPEEKQEQAEV